MQYPLIARGEFNHTITHTVCTAGCDRKVDETLFHVRTLRDEPESLGHLLRAEIHGSCQCITFTGPNRFISSSPRKAIATKQFIRTVPFYRFELGLG